MRPQGPPTTTPPCSTTRCSAASGFGEADRDVSGWFVGGGLALPAPAGSLSLLWSQHLP